MLGHLEDRGGHTPIRGVGLLRDPIRVFDWLDLKASIEYLGQGMSKFRCMPVLRYEEMVSCVFEMRGWDASEFHLPPTVTYPAKSATESWVGNLGAQSPTPQISIAAACRWVRRDWWKVEADDDG